MPTNEIVFVLLTIFATTSGIVFKEVVTRIEENGSNNDLVCNTRINRQMMKCDVEPRNDSVPAGTMCAYLDHQALHLEYFVCHNGFFINVDYLHKGTDVNHVRSKRFLLLITAVVVIGVGIAGVICAVYCGQDTTQKGKNERPIITCPKVDDKVTQKLQTHVEVTWEEPTAIDPEGKDVTIEKISLKNGYSFAQGDHSIDYKATDDAGGHDICSVTFNVKVPVCKEQIWVKNGHALCYPKTQIYGSNCTINCNYGYQLSGNSVKVKTCEANEKWSPSTDVSCEKKKCALPPKLCNGEYECSTSNYEHDTICLPVCKSGYSINLKTTIQCKESTWANESKVPFCQDNQPPEFINCPEHINRFASDDKGIAIVSWSNLIAKDNSETTDKGCGNSSEIKIQQVSGQSSGEKFTVGYHEIDYTATDIAGNVGVCRFTVIVKELSCEPLIVDDQFLLVSCPNGFVYGSTCTFQCFLSYTLTGGENVTCEKDPNDESKAFWNWKNDTQSYCQKLSCPVLPAPAGGALACSEALGNKICTMSCSSKYQVAKGTPIEYVCNDQRIWIQGIPPNCTNKVHPDNAYKPGELFYYFTGDCSDPNVQNGIKENFVNVMENLEGTDGWNNICPSYCTVQGVTVTCGPLNGRRKRDHHNILKRSTSQITVNFNVLSEWNLDKDLWGNDEELTTLTDFMQEKVSTGMFNVSGVVTGIMAIGWIGLSCPIGQEPVYESDSTCVGCPPGKYLKGDDCIDCGKGYYQENEYQINCTKCPQGESTANTGSLSVSDCKDICPPGTFSSTGVVPCSPCPLGQYQSGYESTKCVHCDLLTSTTSTGSSNRTDCHEMDINFINENAFMKLQPLTKKVAEFSIHFYFKCWNITDQLTSFTISNFSVTVGTTLNISIAGHSDSVELDLLNWSRIMVAWQASTREVKVYVNGELQRSHIFNLETAQDIEIAADSFMEILSNTSACSFAGFFLASDALHNEPLTNPKNSCSTYVTKSLYSMDDIYSSEKKGIEFSHSKCDAFDECMSNPCGRINKCVNKHNAYECVCYAGYSGLNCEIPPDFCVDNKCANGGTCTSHFSNYTCTCSNDYTGVTCDTAIVHGNWGLWLEWSECSQSCGGGKQTRFRLCNNPSPDLYGLYCVGSNNSDEACNVEPCPVCPHYLSIYQYKNSFNCSIKAESTSCIVTCQPGYVFAKDFQPLDLYECGPHTAYNWNAKPPPCTLAKSPSKVAAATVVKYTADCKNEDQMQSVLLQNLNELQCIKNKTCSMQTKISGCSDSSKKRSSMTLVDVSIELNSEIFGDNDLNLEDFYTHNIVSPVLLQLIHIYADAASSIIQMNTTDILTLNVSGKSYEADISTLNVTTRLTCPQGTVEQEMVCTDCPMGTYCKNAYCEMCPRQTYQDLTGQLQCKQCPKGFTTLYIASRNVSDCHVPVETEISCSACSVPDNHVLLVVVPTSVVVVVSGIIVGVLVIYKNSLRKKHQVTKPNLMGSIVSLHEVSPSLVTPVLDNVRHPSMECDALRKTNF